MTYQPLFDLGTYGYREGPWWLVGVAIGLVALGLWLWPRLWHKRRQQRHVLPGFLALMGLVASVGAGGVPLWDHHRLMAEFNAGRALVVEGVVSSHSVQEHATRRHDGKGYDRRTWESFRVGEVAFGFDHKASPVSSFMHEVHAAPLANGQRLRVHYVDDVPGDYSQRRIVRVERAT